MITFYHAHHSTETSLPDVTNRLFGGADEGHVSVLTIPDFSAAFDALDHSIIFARLHDMYGLSGEVLGRFSSYLCDRVQAVSVNGRVTSHKKLHY